MCALGFSQSLRQTQTQSLVLAPQLRQSLKILQVSALDLRTTIQDELQTNPSLEDISTENDSFDSKIETTAAAENTEAPARDELSFDGSFEVLKKLGEDYQDFMSEAGGATQRTSEDDERRQHFFDSLVTETSLQEHLMDQASLSDLPPEQFEAIEYLVGSLGNNGFLTASLSDIALISNIPLGDVQAAHKILRQFEPPGIASFDVQDCLLFQLESKDRKTSLAYSIIKKQFKLLSRKRIPDIARKLNSDVDSIQNAIKEIALLDPAPGRQFAEDTNRSVLPDVVAQKVEGKWKITLNSDYIPQLRISPMYKEMIARGSLTKEEKDYIQEKMRAGKFLISSIEQRQQTIERISNEILKVQNDFFEEGVSKLRPCTMTQVAEAVGVHETTVSRAIANKYMQTPHGIRDMKSFFTPGYKGSSGEAVSNSSVKDMIASLVAAENTAKPLSDQELVNQLKDKGIKIARRTVAKYREEQGILSSNLRRQY